MADKLTFNGTKTHAGRELWGLVWSSADFMKDSPLTQGGANADFRDMHFPDALKPPLFVTVLHAPDWLVCGSNSLN